MPFPPYHPFRSAEARDRYLAGYDRRAAHWPVPSREAFVETAFGRTFVRSSGPEDGPPMVLLPGIGATSLMWMAMVEALAATRRVHAVDHIFDHGRSVWSRPVRSGAEYAVWLDEVLGGLSGGRPVDLVGASYGGWMACEHALRHAERLSHLVLVAPVGAVLHLSPAFAARAMLAQVPARACFRQMMGWLAWDLARGDDRSRAIFEEMVDDGYTSMRWFAPRRPVPPRRLSDGEWASLRVPTLFLVGRNERIFSPTRAVARLHRVAPGGRCKVVEGAGHDLFIVQPEAASRAILDFLDGGP